jgi:TonB family protein
MRVWCAIVLLTCGSGCARAPFGLRSIDGGVLARPSYPALLAASGVEGESVVDVVWRDDGTLDSTKTHRLRETHAQFTESVLAAVRQWRASAHHVGPLRVEALFALTNGLCSARDSVRKQPASRARMSARDGVLHILVEGDDCLPYRPPVAARSGARDGVVWRAGVHE